MSGRVVHVNDNVEGAVYIGRAVPRKGLKTSMFANPNKIGKTVSRRTSIIWYEQHLVTHPELYAELPNLRGRPLACWCRHDGEERTANNECHGDVLVNLLAFYTDDELRALAVTP